MLIDHLVATPEAMSRPPAMGKLYDYMLAGNGVFIRARREGLDAQIPVVRTQRKIAGLPDLKTCIGLPVRVPGSYLQVMLDASKVALPLEILFSLSYGLCKWRLYIPPQTASGGSVRPADAYDGEFANAVIEVHSHNSMPAFFSTVDDRDETGFRIYAVIGRVDTLYPEINVRVGVYGHWAAIPAWMVFDDLGSFIDVNTR